MIPGMFSRVSALLLVSLLLFATEPSAETRRWWGHVQALANDGMEGRDTGSPGYTRAAQYVTKQFASLHLEPAGDKGYNQTVPLRKLRFHDDRSSAELATRTGVKKLRWLEQIAVPANAALPASIEAPLVFVGSPAYASQVDVKGKIVVQLNPRRVVKDAKDPVLRKLPEGAIGILGIDRVDSLEAPRWPVAYSEAVTIRDEAPAQATAPASLLLRFNPEHAEALFEGSGHTYKELRAGEAEEKALASFDLPATLRLKLVFESTEVASDNLLAMLPGEDPQLRNEVIVLSAHLDGYGVGSAWKTDSVYNGCFDDAAYVATLIETAEKLRTARVKLRRSVLFAVFTGEEKGLLGSRYFTRHLTLPRERLVANINLDQLRPLFPLKVLAMVGMQDSTLGETARRVAGPLGLRIEADNEPWRNLIRRADNWNFMQIGVPAAGFVLAPESGTQDAEIYREWYRLRYHTPLDDLKQPWDPGAAAKFHEFFLTLVETLSNSSERPQWSPQSPYAPKAR